MMPVNLFHVIKRKQIDGYKNAMKHAYPHLEIKAYIYSLNLEQFIGL